MPYRQVYYTSCTTGLRGGKGFQVNAATAGIEPTVLQQVERLGVYVPPPTAPTRPTAEELERFPVSLLFARFPDGSAVIAQAKYMGADYSGRFGNFFTHSLVAARPETELETVLPVELWRSPMWCTTESPSTTLPALDSTTPGGVITPARVEQFLGDGGRFEHLGTMITAVEQALVTRRKLIIVEESEAVALWIAAASYALPRHIALQLTFNTYAKNPYSTDALIVGTTADSDFKFAPHEIEHQYFVFDFPGQRYTRLAAISAFAHAVAAAYKAGRAGDVSGFGRFVAETAPTLPVSELGIALAAYSAASGMPVTGAAGDELLRWCIAHLGHMNAHSVSTILALVTTDGAASPSIVEACSDLYRASQETTVPAAVRACIESAYVKWVLREVLRATQVDVLTRAVARITYPASAVDLARPLRPTWLGQLREMQEPARLSTSLLVGDALGLLGEGDDVLRRVAETAMGPLLANACIQSTIEKLVGKPSGRALLLGVGTYLETRVGDPEVFSKLARFLGKPAIADVLEHFALEEKSFGLYCRIFGARASVQPESRSRLFERCLSTLRGQGVELGSYIDNAFDAIWPNARTTVDEALYLVDLLKPETLAGTLIPHSLAGALVAGADLRRPDQRRDDLAAKLSVPGVADALGDKALIVEAFKHAAALRRRDGDRSNAVRSAIECSAKISGELAGGLLDLAAERLVEIEPLDQHVALLLQANDVTRGRFMSQYGRAVNASLSGSGTHRPRTAGRLFLICLRIERSRGDGLALAAPLLHDVLPSALKGWGNDDLDAMGDIVLRDPSARSSWQQWRESLRPRGVLNRLKRWIR